MSLRYLCVFICVVLLYSCTASNQKPAEGDAKISIIYNNDNFAYLEPCGCRVTPIGGMDRRWNAMVSIPAESKVFIDSGNLLFKTTTVADYLAPQWFEQAKGVIEAYNILQADAVGLGETEFALGLKKFQELAKLAKFPFISSNIYWKSSGKLFTEDSVIVERHGKKIGIFALFSPNLVLPPELVARNVDETANAMVKKLKSEGVDMIVLLSHQGYDEDVALAKKVKGIDLLVGGHSQSLLQSPDTEGDTLIVQLSSQGQMLGLVEYEAAKLPAKRTKFKVEELNSEYDKGPSGKANPMKALLSVTNLKIMEANKRLDDKVWAEKSGKNAPYDTYLSCRTCHSAQFKFQETKLHAVSFLTLLSKKQESNLDCVKCHSVGLGKVNGFKSLADAFRNAEDENIPLAEILKHAGTGFPPKDVGYREHPELIQPHAKKWVAAMDKAGVKKAFVSVQCESCHGQLPGHPFSSGTVPKVSTSLCLQCHTKEQMPSWYDAKGAVKEQTLAEALKSIKCPKD